jgi:hypothetical protein
MNLVQRHSRTNKALQFPLLETHALKIMLLLLVVSILLLQIHIVTNRVQNGNCMQILCRALGGRTGRSSKGWDIGVSCVHPTAAAARLFAPLRLPVHMPVIEFHQDEVWELPPKAEVLARSDKTGVEMFRLGDSAMGVQGHPEYSKDILMSIADRLLRNNLILVRTVTSPSSCAHLTHTAGFLGLRLGRSAVTVRHGHGT